MKVTYQTCYGVDVHKSFLVATITKTTSSFNDCGNEKRFVNIDTTTGWVSNFHKSDSFRKR